MIERFKKSIKLDNSVIRGSGDDCAVIKSDKANYLLFTCDMIVEGIDFKSTDNPELVGRKALAVSISDIAACAGMPRYAVVSIGLPVNSTVEKARRIAKGLFDLAGQYNINVVGGDLSRARNLVIDVSILGIVKKSKLVLRSGAREGDIILATGVFGGSIKGKHLRFTPRIEEAKFLTDNFKINSMIDVSDGLVQDLNHILTQSKLGAVIYEDLIPLSNKAEGMKDALYSGEDFELLFTMPVSDAKKLLKRDPVNFNPIGEIIKKKYGLRLVDKKGKQKAISPGGFCHF